LWDEVQTSLSKLTDPAKTGKHTNLSLEQLQKRIEALGNLQLAAPLRILLNDLHDKSQAFRTRRHKKLAHLDLNTAIHPTASTLPGVSRLMIETALSLVRDYMNVIELHYMNSQTAYEHPGLASDGEALILMLKYATRYDQLMREQKIHWDDWRSGYWKDA
jgi:hypothetical protein